MKKHKLISNCYLRLKKQLTIILIIAVIPATQSYAQFGIALGPKAGVGVTTFRGLDEYNIDERTGWVGGLFLNIQFTPVFTLQPELLLSEKGAEYSDNNYSVSAEISYFEVPVLAKFRIPINDIFFPHIAVGPNFAFRTDLKYSGRQTDSGATINLNKDEIRKHDIGAIVGAGLDIQTRDSGIFFTIDGRYGIGFTNINKNDDVIEVRNAGWRFAAGIGFLIKN